MTDEQSFLLSLAEPRPQGMSDHDWICLQDGICNVFADWLEEQGDSRQDGYRIMGTMSVHPVKSLPSSGNGEATWDWWSGKVYEVADSHQNYLQQIQTAIVPEDLFQQMGPDKHHKFREYRDRIAAEDAFCQIITNNLKMEAEKAEKILKSPGENTPESSPGNHQLWLDFFSSRRKAAKPTS